MKNRIGTLIAVGLMLMAGAVGADDAKSSDANKAITDALAKVFPNTQAESIKPSEVPGLYEVVVGPTLLYMSADGRYLMQGKLIDIEAREDVTEPKLAAARVQALNKVGEDKMIIFGVKPAKYTVSVFTDIDCGYCRKLHSEIDQYLAQGITVRYLFFPRAGEDSESYRKAVSVWCTKDRNTALTQAKRDQPVERKECENPVLQHMDLAKAMGTNGTPMIVTEGGEIIPGYVNAKQLVKMLAFEKSGKKIGAEDAKADSVKKP